MRVLVLNGASAGKAAPGTAGVTGLVAALSVDHDGQAVVVAQADVPAHGAAGQFPILTQNVLQDAGWAGGPDLIVGVVGPGSFTGIRATLALASGLSLGFGCPAVGVTLGAALRAMPGAEGAICILAARRDRCFVDDGLTPPYATAPALLRIEDGPALLAGDGVDMIPAGAFPAAVRLKLAVPDAMAILRAARGGPALPLRPIYVDPPEARPPAGGLRPSPEA